MFRTINECAVELVSVSRYTDSMHINTGYPFTEMTDNTDLMPVTAARVSFGRDSITGKDLDKDKKLMKYLAEHKHTSCFEHQTATFMLEVPLFIRGQIMRHRTFSYNEISRRYTDENIEFWIPDKWRKQSASNKQASTDEAVANSDYLNTAHIDYLYDALTMYTSMLERGVCREQARAVLPQSLLTRFYMTGNLRNWQHFLELRRDGHSQKEVQVVAERIAAKLREEWQESCEVLGI